MKIFSIYKAINKINNKVYIGFDSNWPKRKGEHLRESFYKNHSAYNYVLHKAIRKYGKEAFDWEILYQSLNGKHCLNIIEPYLIKEYDSFVPNGYNMTIGGEGTFGWIPLKTTKDKIGNANRGKTYRALNWKAISPLGVKYTFYNMADFCRKKDLNPGCMSMVASHKQSHHKGWICEVVSL